MSDDTELLNSSEIAALLRVSRKTVFELIARDRLPCRKVGREYRFIRQAVLAWVASPKKTLSNRTAP